MRLKRAEDVSRDPILKLEYIGCRPVVSPRPDGRIGGHIDQLGINPQAGPLSLHASVQQITNLEFACDLAKIFRSIAVPQC